jgi:hypothetical protein
MSTTKASPERPVAERRQETLAKGAKEARGAGLQGARTDRAVARREAQIGEATTRGWPAAPRRRASAWSARATPARGPRDVHRRRGGDDPHAGRGPFRSLADPKLYTGQPKVDLRLEDPAYSTVSPEHGARHRSRSAARAVKGSILLSVTTGFGDNRSGACVSTRTAHRGPGRHQLRPAQVSAKDPRPPARGRRPGHRALLWGDAEGGGDRPHRLERTPSRLGRRRPSRACSHGPREPGGGPSRGGAHGSPLRPGPAAEAARSSKARSVSRWPARFSLHRRPAGAEGFRSRLFDSESPRKSCHLEKEEAAQLLRGHLLRKKLQMAPTTGGRRT